MIIETEGFEKICPICKGLTTHSQWTLPPCDHCKGTGKVPTSMGYDLEYFLERRGWKRGDTK